MKIYNDYKQDISMGLIEHKTLFTMSDSVEVTSSATEILEYDVPAGSVLLLDKIDFSKGVEEAVTVSITVDDEEKLIWTTISNGEYDLNNYKINGGETLNVLGSGATTGDMSVNIFGVLVKTNSVPVDITSFAATAGEEEVTLSWDAASETDQKCFSLTYGETANNKTNKTITIANGETSYEITGLDNDVEYTFSLVWVGYDDKKSTPVTDTATPIVYAPTGFSATGEDGNVALAWTDTSSSETGIEIWKSLTTGTGFTLLTTVDPDEVSYDDSDVVNDTEYFYKIRFIAGEDYSAFTSEANATPGEAPTSIDMAMFSKTSMGSDTLTGDYFYTDDEGASWNSGVSGVVEGAMNNPATDGTRFYAMYNSLTNVSTDGINWTQPDAAVTVRVLATDGLAIRDIDSVGQETSIDGTTWNTCSGLPSLGGAGIVKLGSTYYVVSGTTVYESTNGTTWTEMANQPTTVTQIEFLISNGTQLLVVCIVEGGAEVIYEYSTGGAWSVGTSSFTPTGLAVLQTVAHDGYFYTIAVEDDFSTDYFERSIDGNTWTAVTLPTITGALGIAVGSDGTNLYVGQLDLAENNQYITVDNGSGWETPIQVTTASTVIVETFAGITA